jgi:hypothetical protein
MTKSKCKNRNVAKNTSELGTGTWEPWEPGNSSGIIAEYFYFNCFTTTTTTTTIPLVNTDSLFKMCSSDCGNACPGPIFTYYNIWMTQECIDTWPSIGCGIWEKEDRTDPFPDGTYNLGNGDCIVITGGIITDILTY